MGTYSQGDTGKKGEENIISVKSSGMQGVPRDSDWVSVKSTLGVYEDHFIELTQGTWEGWWGRGKRGGERERRGGKRGGGIGQGGVILLVTAFN